MNSCSCLGTPTVSTPPACTPNTDCLIMSDIIVACQDAVGPCGAIGTLNFVTHPSPPTSYNHNTTGCGLNSLNFKLLDWDKELFTSVTLSGSTISWTTTQDTTKVNKFGVVKMKAVCVMLSSLFCITICLKNLCQNNTCTTSQECNKCTGVCQAKSIDVSIGDSSANIDINVV